MACWPNLSTASFVNEGLLEHYVLIHLYIICGCFPTTTTELNSCDGDHMTQKA